jgi:hypothetical protein
MYARRSPPIINADNSALGVAIGLCPVQSGANDMERVAMSKEPEKLVMPKTFKRRQIDLSCE